MDNSDMEMSLDEDDDNEIKMIIASKVSNRNMWYYQMKLLTYKSNVTGKLLKVVMIMFSKELQMEIELHDSMNDNFEVKIICSIDELHQGGGKCRFHQLLCTTNISAWFCHQMMGGNQLFCSMHWC
jgi:hypothetical protein